jgi:nitroimidazol reductase NimA-like FMN-containing flavoprotein (pyridoxamine 5'-phosphate oxidase superfamily)
MRTLDLVGGTEIVSEHDCWDFLATQSIGRLAVTMDGQIEIFPVNYGLDGDGIIFRTNAGRKVTWATSGEVAFEVDSVDEATHSGWSVVVHGTARDISRFDGPQRRAAAQPWAGHKDFLVRIAPRSISGRRVAPQ